jgi:hypothetical protein
MLRRPPKAKLSCALRRLVVIKVQPLTPPEIRATYPLIREVAPGLALAEWTRFARRLLGSEGSDRAGIMVARIGDRAIPIGLYIWHVVRELGAGRVLTAEKIVAFDLTDRRVVADALVDSLEALTKRLGVDAVKAVMHGSSADVAARFRGAGLQPAAEILMKSAAAHTA